MNTRYLMFVGDTFLSSMSMHNSFVAASDDFLDLNRLAEEEHSEKYVTLLDTIFYSTRTKLPFNLGWTEPNPLYLPVEGEN